MEAPSILYLLRKQWKSSAPINPPLINTSGCLVLPELSFVAMDGFSIPLQCLHHANCVTLQQWHPSIVQCYIDLQMSTSLNSCKVFTASLKNTCQQFMELPTTLLTTYELSTVLGLNPAMTQAFEFTFSQKAPRLYPLIIPNSSLEIAKFVHGFDEKEAIKWFVRTSMSFKIDIQNCKKKEDSLSFGPIKCHNIDKTFQRSRSWFETSEYFIEYTVHFDTIRVSPFEFVRMCYIIVHFCSEWYTQLPPMTIQSGYQDIARYASFLCQTIQTDAVPEEKESRMVRARLNMLPWYHQDETWLEDHRDIVQFPGVFKRFYYKTGLPDKIYSGLFGVDENGQVPDLICVLELWVQTAEFSLSYIPVSEETPADRICLHPLPDGLSDAIAPIMDEHQCPTCNYLAL